MFLRRKSQTVVNKKEIGANLVLFILLLLVVLIFSSISTTTTTTTTATAILVVSAFSPTTSIIPIEQREYNRRIGRRNNHHQHHHQQRAPLFIAPISSTTTTKAAMTTIASKTTSCVGTNTNTTNNTTTNNDTNTTISLLQKRLYEDHGIPIGDTILIIDDENEDCCDEEKEEKEEVVVVEDDEEKKEEDNEEKGSNQKIKSTIVVEIKTLVWEVQLVVTTSTTKSKVVTAAGATAGDERNDNDNDDDENNKTITSTPPVTTTTTTRTFYIVTALPMKDKVDISKFKKMILDQTTSVVVGLRSDKSECEPQIINKKIQSLQLAPLNVAESLTGYQSGCMSPICHTTNDILQLYLDESIIDIHKQQQQQQQQQQQKKIDNDDNNELCCCLASIGSGIVGTSLRLPLYQFLRVAVAGTNTTTTTTTTVTGSFIVSNESKMMSSIEVRKQQMLLQKNNLENDDNDNDDAKYCRTVKKDRLKEYRSFDKDDIVSKSKLLRSTARKKGRIHEMQVLINEALQCDDGDDEFPKLFQTNEQPNNNDDEPNQDQNQNQNPRTRPNIYKNALHICAWRGDYETVIHLVETSKKYYPTLDIVNIISKGRGNYGKTPIFFALTQCRDDVVRYLISEDANANLLIVNNKGQTPCSIARSHMSDDTCQLLYNKEAEQLRKGNKFINYRDSIHSDHKLYGDLDPRFPIDNNNRYNSDDNGYYNYNVNDDDDDIADQIREYQKSVAQAQLLVLGQQPNNYTTIIDGIPTQFTPRSLRPTTRWWNRNDQSLAAANYDGDGSGGTGQTTFTQSHRSSNNSNDNIPQRTTEDGLNDGVKMMMKPKPKQNKIDIESLDLISIDEVLRSAVAVAAASDEYQTEENSSSAISPSPISNHDNAILVDSFESLRLFEDEVEKCIFKIQQHLFTDDDVDDDILVKYAWGIDCEWKPGPDCGMDSPVSTLQLSTSRKSFLIDVQTLIHSTSSDRDAEGFESVSSSKVEVDLDRILLKLFLNPGISLVGYGVIQDLGKLSASFAHMKCFSEYVSVIDLQSISSVVYKNNKHDRGTMSSLQKMTATLLEKRLDKSQQVSDWSRRPLSEEQITYAMLDAAIIPLLLKAVVEQSAVLERYNNELFKAHKNLRSTIRYTPIKPCEEGFAYEITYGSTKSTLGKNFARQTWPTSQQLIPPLPNLVPYHHPSSYDDSSSSKTKISKKERAHNKKIGGGVIGRKRPKAIPLKILPGSLEKLPMPGITLGYTKESCAFRVVGHEMFKTIPDGTYIGFNRRAGVIETTNAYILFCNFGGGNVFSEFSNEGRLLSFRVKQGTESGRSSEASLYNDEREGKMKKDILLFARESTRTKYTYCGSCNCTDAIALDSASKSLVLELNNYDELIDHKSRISSTFENLVFCSQKAAV